MVLMHVGSARVRVEASAAGTVAYRVVFPNSEPFSRTPGRAGALPLDQSFDSHRDTFVEGRLGSGVAVVSFG